MERCRVSLRDAVSDKAIHLLVPFPPGARGRHRAVRSAMNSQASGSRSWSRTGTARANRHACGARHRSKSPRTVHPLSFRGERNAIVRPHQSYNTTCAMTSRRSSCSANSTRTSSWYRPRLPVKTLADPDRPWRAEAPCPLTYGPCRQRTSAAYRRRAPQGNGEASNITRALQGRARPRNEHPDGPGISRSASTISRGDRPEPGTGTVLTARGGDDHSSVRRLANGATSEFGLHRNTIPEVVGRGRPPDAAHIQGAALQRVAEA